MNFTAIDFETANNNMSSACSVAAVRVESGLVKEKLHQLLLPAKNWFSSLHISIHGIKPDDVKDKPKFSEFWPVLRPWLDGQIVVAHNASFDMGVLKALMREYNLHPAEFSYCCSCQMARRVWPELPNHRLSTVAGHIGYPFRHHDALEDAGACAAIVLSAARQFKEPAFERLAGKINLRQKRFV